MDAVQKANSGHPGTPMALAPIALRALHARSCATRPEHPEWPNRDRFVLSAGHASMLLYSILYLTGYGVSLDDLKHFRQLGSPTAGHPEYGHAPGIEATTGPLGQGIAMCTGLALGERMLNARLGDDVIDHYTFMHRLRRRHAGGRLGRGRVARRPPRARPPRRLLRRQPHLDRGRHRALVLRGRRQALRGLRLARPEPRRGPRPRPHRAGRARRDGRRRPAVADHRAARTSRPARRTSRTPRPRTDRRSARRRSASPSRPTAGTPTSRSTSPTRRCAHFRACDRARQRALVREWEQRSGGWSGFEMPDGWDDDLPDVLAARRADDRHAQGRRRGRSSGRRPRCRTSSAARRTSRPRRSRRWTGSVEPGSYDGRLLHFGIREHAMGADRQRPRAERLPRLRLGLPDLQRLHEGRRSGWRR